MSKAPTLEEFLQSVEEADYWKGKTDRDYLAAVYAWVEEYAVNNWEDVEYILDLAEEHYVGNFARSADYGEAVGEAYFSERLDAIQEAAIGKNGRADVHIPYTIDWQEFAELVLINVPGMNWSAYDDGEPGTGAHYFREPR
jgi:hypothetical protein